MSPTSLSWIRIQIYCDFYFLQPQYRDTWGIAKCEVVSDEYCPRAATSPILWPVYVFQFIVTLLLLMLCTFRTKVFLFFLSYTSSLQLSDTCLIYGSLLNVQATVVLFFFLLSYKTSLQSSYCLTCPAYSFLIVVAPVRLIYYKDLNAFAYLAIPPSVCLSLQSYI